MTTTGDTAATPVGPDAVAARLLLGDALVRADLDAETRRVVLTRLAGILPGIPTPTGTALEPRRISADQLDELLPGAAAEAAGLEPGTTRDTTPAIMWTGDGGELLVLVAGVRARVGDGIVDVTVPVRCDETGDAEVVVTFVTGSPDRPTGGVTATEDRPRGPAVVVENWGEALVAYAWRVVLVATDALAGAIGTDARGRRLVVASMEASADGLAVVPLARHFPATAAARR